MKKQQLEELLFILFPSLLWLIIAPIGYWLILWYFSESTTSEQIISKSAFLFVFVCIMAALFQGGIALIRYFNWLMLKTPSCPLCGSWMKLKTEQEGWYRGDHFWGCRRNGCQGKIPIRNW